MFPKFTPSSSQDNGRNQNDQDPGCAADIPAAFYNLSFAPNPNSSKVFPSQAEILDYFNSVAERFDVTRHVVPKTE